MQLFLEKIAPYILSLTATYLWWKFKIVFPVNDSVLSASLTLGAILTGFLATSKAILMTILNFHHRYITLDKNSLDALKIVNDVSDTKETKTSPESKPEASEA